MSCTWLEVGSSCMCNSHVTAWAAEMEADDYTKAPISRRRLIHTLFTCFEGVRLSDPPLSAPPNCTASFSNKRFTTCAWLFYKTNATPRPRHESRFDSCRTIIRAKEKQQASRWHIPMHIPMQICCCRLARQTGSAHGCAQAQPSSTARRLL